MTCVCNKTNTPAPRIDWSKPVQWNPRGNAPEYREEWADVLVCGKNSKGYHIIETKSGYLYSATDEGKLTTAVVDRIYVRNKPVQTKREWIEVEVYRTTKGGLHTRVAKSTNLPYSETLVAKAPVQIEYEVE